MDEKVKRKNNALTQAQAATLRAWLVARREEAANEFSFPLALQASVVLGFNVTSNNVLFHKRSLGIVKPAPAAAGECRCRELAQMVVALYDHAKISPPLPLLDMAGIMRKRAIYDLELPLAEGLRRMGIETGATIAGSSPTKFEAAG